MADKTIRHFFPGSNTAAGFVGFFENLRSLSRRSVILKGGPGVGKSTLMREAGAHFERLGLPVEYYHCSGDPDSLDAVFAPEAGYLILDGTAPHIVDPRFPGARDGILNLGVCLDETQLSTQAPEIEALNSAISACYAQAYRYLRAALAVRQDADAVYQTALSDAERRRIVHDLLSRLPGGPLGDERHCFAQAITWKGVLQEMDAVITDAVCCLDVPWGFDTDLFLAPLWAAAEQAGLHRIACHDPLDAGRLGHVQAGGTLFTSAALMDAPAITPEWDAGILRRETSRLKFDRAVHDLCLNQAVECLSAAKSHHDALERYYIDAMDYARLDDMKEGFLSSLPRA